MTTKKGRNPQHRIEDIINQMAELGYKGKNWKDSRIYFTKDGEDAGYIDILHGRPKGISVPPEIMEQIKHIYPPHHFHIANYPAAEGWKSVEGGTKEELLKTGVPEEVIHSVLWRWSWVFVIPEEWVEVATKMNYDPSEWEEEEPEKDDIDLANEAERRYEEAGERMFERLASKMYDGEW